MADAVLGPRVSSGLAAAAGAVALVTALATVWGHPGVALALGAAPLATLALAVSPHLLVTLVVFEMALGGWGHLIDVGPLSLRQLLVGAALGAWLVRRVVIHDASWPLTGASLAVLLALVVAGTALLISLALGHPAALQDGLTPAFLLLFFLFSDLCRTPAGVRRLGRVFLNSILALALLQLALNASLFLGLLEPHGLSRALAAVANFTVVSPRFARIFLVGSVLFPVALTLLAARWLAGVPWMGPRRDAAAATLVGIALVLTFTRGFWLVTIVAVLLLWLVTTRGGRVRWILAGVLLVGAALPLIAVESEGVAVLGDRVLALFAGGGDQSVTYRLELYPRLLQHIAARPLFGYGVGLPIDGLLYVENSYLYYALKVGLLGTACVLVPWLWLLGSAARLASVGRTLEARAVGAGWAAATAAILVLTAINPFINSPVGMYFLTLGLAVVTATARPGVADHVVHA